MWGFWPGAWVLLIIVKDDTWATDLTVAALIHGAPIKPHIRLMTFTNTMSKWKPLPFCSLRSFLAIISLRTMNFFLKKLFFWRNTFIPRKTTGDFGLLVCYKTEIVNILPAGRKVVARTFLFEFFYDKNIGFLDSC